MVQFCGSTAKVFSSPKRLNENITSAGVVSHEAAGVWKQQNTQDDSEGKGVQVKSHVPYVYEESNRQNGHIQWTFPKVSQHVSSHKPLFKFP